MNKKFQTNRPLLNVQRFEVRQFVVFWKLPIYPDQSNQKTNILRNKIRKQIMPTLRTFFNPRIDFALTNFTKITSDEQLYFLNILNSLLKIKRSYPRFVLFVFTFSYFVVLNKANPFIPKVSRAKGCLLRVPSPSVMVASRPFALQGKALPLVSEASTGGSPGLLTLKTGEGSKQNSMLAMFTKRDSFLWDTKKLWHERKGLTKSVLFFRNGKGCYSFLGVTRFPFETRSNPSPKVKGTLASPSVKHSNTLNAVGTNFVRSNPSRFLQSKRGQRVEGNIVLSPFEKDSKLQHPCYTFLPSGRKATTAEQERIDQVGAGCLFLSAKREGGALLTKGDTCPFALQGKASPPWQSTRSKQQHNFSFLTNEKSNCENVIRNKVIYELVVRNGTINTFYSYPLVFQKRILKQLLKTLPLVENTLIKKDKRKLTQLLIINHIEKLLTQKEKKALLIVILKTMNKHSIPYL